MGRVHVPIPLLPARRARLRDIIKSEPWKAASSARYADAPHTYLICFWYPKPATGVSLWKEFADAIKECGEYKTWKGYRYKYLQIDSYVYWVDFPALNRAKAETLDA